MSDPSTNEQTVHRLELVLKGTGLGMWDWYPQTGAVSFNERWCEMLGYGLEEIEPSIESWSSRVHPDDLKACYDDINAHIEGRTTFYVNTHRMKHKDGSWRYILDRGQVMERNDKGEPVRFTGSHEDVTDRVKAKQDLKLALEELKNKHDREVRMYAVIGHELRTPASVLQMLLNAAEDGEPLDIKLLKSNIEQLLSVIDKLRTVAQPATLAESGCSTFLLGDLLDEQVRSLSKLAETSGLILSAKIDGLHGHMVYAQRTLLRQVTSNLIKNAIVHSGGTEVSVIASGELIGNGLKRVKIIVEDNGVGIPEAEVSKLFEPFTRGSSTADGMGLGLHVCKVIIDNLGGSLTFEPLPPKGSRFIVELEVKTATASSANTVKATRPRSFQGKKVLLAEDNLTLLLLTERLFTLRGATVIKAENGEQALSCFDQEEGFDLVVTDLFMPVMDGCELIKQLRARGFTLPIIGLTAASLGSETEQMLNVGANVVFRKPVDIEKLLQFVEGVTSPDF